MLTEIQRANAELDGAIELCDMLRGKVDADVLLGVWTDYMAAKEQKMERLNKEQANG